ncbi:MAG TPA: DUF72 domain-containing protein [Vicinamibacteria bacterium]
MAQIAGPSRQLIPLRVGVAGWSYPDWEGVVYPATKPPRFDPLTFLVGFFDTIEINSTFYRPPKPSTAASWARRSEGNADFRFTTKLYKSFTHERAASSEDEALVKDGLAPLVEAGKLGALLLQFPWSFKNDPDSRQYLDGLLDRFRDYPLVMEVRHASWDQPEFYEYLSGRGVGFCNIDQPRIGRSLGPSERTTGPVGYVRLHGRNYRDWFREDAGRDARYDYLYTDEELDPWMDKVSRIAEDSAETYVITNNHFRGQAAVNALQIKARLKKQEVPAPASLIDAYPVLGTVAIRREEARSPSSLPSPGRLFD